MKIKKDEQDESDIEIRVNILQVESKTTKNCMEFIKESGDTFEFNEIYRNIREFFGGLVNAKE